MRIPSVVGCFASIALVGACGDGGRGMPIRFNFQRSCTTTPGTYSTECVAAIEARLLDASGAPLQSQCSEVDAGVFAYALDLNTNDEIFPVLEGVRPRDAAYLEVRGYHDLVRADPCADGSPRRDDLMFWGRSELLDLTDDNLEEVELDIECRDRCDCSALDTDDACPFGFNDSLRVCTPPTWCRRDCDDASDCWDPETFRCEGGHCLPQEDEGTCFECDSDNDCAEGRVCVSHDFDVDTERFCAPLCPSESSLEACPGRMACELPDGEELVRLP